MKNNIASIYQSQFVRNVLIVASGTAAAQMITMGLSPIITRLYGPEAFGLLGVFNAMVAILAPVAALTFPIAIVLPKEDREAKGLARLSIFISILLSLTIVLTLLIFSQQIISIFQLESIGSFIFLIPLVILFAGSLQVAEQWLIRKKQFKVTAKVTFFGALMVQGGIVLVGLLSPIAATLIIFTVLGQGLKSGLMMLYSKSAMYKRNHDETPAHTKKQLVRKYIDFPKYRAPETFINAISQSFPILLLTTFFGPASAGFYTLGKTVLAMPTHLLGKSVGDVFYPKISEAENNGEKITGLIKKATVTLGAIGIIPFGLVILFGPWLFSFVFGADWVTAGEYARWIALWSLFGFMNRPSVMALPVLSAQSFHLKMTIAMLVVRMAALAVGYYLFKSDTMAIAFFGISGAVLNLILILLTLRISLKHDSNIPAKQNN